jgi:hypothetical protein
MVHFFWPTPGINQVPRWWFFLWAWFGFRSPYQSKKTVQQIVDGNTAYCARNLCYLSHKKHEELSKSIFGNCKYSMNYYLQNAYGGAAWLYRQSPFKKPVAWLFKHTRIALMVQRKVPASVDLPGYAED